MMTVPWTLGAPIQAGDRREAPSTSIIFPAVGPGFSRMLARAAGYDDGATDGR